ncbi:MAG: bifunctional nuclease domain-containing protein [Thermomicrobiales bacterium]
MNRDEQDAPLVHAARGGDKTALGVLLTRHRPLLLAVCRRALGDDALAEDAAQEASLLALLNLDRLRSPERFGSWLAGIGLNVCHRWNRQRSRDAWSWQAVAGGRIVTEPVDPAPAPADEVEAVELREWVERAVAGLPPGQRAAVVLHYLMGLTQAEAAALLGIEVGTVKTRLHKARANLRQRLWDAAADAATREEERAMVDMRVSDVRRRREQVSDETQCRHIVVLEEIGGTRRLPIWIGEFEATALALLFEGTSVPRPMTYAFAAEILQAAGGRLREVRLDRLVGDVYYATAVVTGAAGEREIDARPSDAFNLALLLEAPIRVAPDVLELSDPERYGEEWAKLDQYTDGPAVIAAAITTGWATAALEEPKEGSS